MKEQLPIFYVKEDADAYYWDVPDPDGENGERKKFMIFKEDIREAKEKKEAEMKDEKDARGMVKLKVPMWEL